MVRFDASGTIFEPMIVRISDPPTPKTCKMLAGGSASDTRQGMAPWAGVRVFLLIPYFLDPRPGRIKIVRFLELIFSENGEERYNKYLVSLYTTRVIAFNGMGVGRGHGKSPIVASEDTLPVAC